MLVTGAGGSASSNFVNSLRMSKEKFTIVGTDINRYHIELNDLDARYIVPESKSPNYLSALNRIIEDRKVDFVHPQPDMEVLALAKIRENLKAPTFLPKTSTLEYCQDKMRTTARLAELGIPVPKTFRVDSEDELDSIISELQKRNQKVWMRATHGAGSKAALPITRSIEAKGWIDYWASNKGIGYHDFIACEYLPGSDYAWQSLWKDGELIVSQARKRVMYLYGFLSPSGTSSTPSVAVTVHNSAVNETAHNAVKAIDEKASGIFCVDLKENQDGVPCVTEINAGRFFTTSNFLATAGCNMPYYYVKLGLNEEIPKLPKYNAVPEGLYLGKNGRYGISTCPRRRMALTNSQRIITSELTYYQDKMNLRKLTNQDLIAISVIV